MSDEDKVDQPAHAPSAHEPMPEGEEEAPRGVRAAAIVRWAIVLAVAVVAAVVVGRWLAGDEGGQAEGTIYYCPMHPQIVQDGPGECPICGMDLVPRLEEPPQATSEADGGAGVPGLVPVTLSDDRLQRSGIRTAKAAKKSLTAQIEALGVVSADERHFAEVTARVSGWLTAGRAVAIGDRVRRGQALGSIQSPEVLAAERELLQVKNLGRAQALTGVDLAAPVRQRLEILGVPPAQIDRVERAGRPSGLVPISAPIAGHVIARNGLPGAFVDRGASIYQIADLGTVWVLVDVYPRDLARVRVGQRAQVQVEGGAAAVAEGAVTYVYPTTDPGTRTTKLRIELPNPELQVRPGLYANVRLAAEPVEGVVIPVEAVADTGELQYVFVARGSGRFEPRAVELGTRAGAEVVVTRGLAEGEEIVTSSAFLLDSESRLRAAVQGHGSRAPSAHEGHGGAAP